MESREGSSSNTVSPVPAHCSPSIHQLQLLLILSVCPIPSFEKVVFARSFWKKKIIQVILSTFVVFPSMIFLFPNLPTFKPIKFGDHAEKSVSIQINARLSMAFLFHMSYLISRLWYHWSLRCQIPNSIAPQ